MPKEGAVAPKERINITFKPAVGGAQEEVELPLKLLVLGDFIQREDLRKLETANLWRSTRTPWMRCWPSRH